MGDKTQEYIIDCIDYFIDSTLQVIMNPHLRVELWRETGASVGYYMHIRTWNAIEAEIRS